MEEQPEYQAEKEARELKKEKERKEKEHSRFRRRLKSYAVFVGIIAAVGFSLYFLVRGNAPSGQDFSRPIPLMRADHIAVGSALPEYTSNPPTSGPHYGQTARSGFREEIIPDQYIIHNLEHGDVWIAYHPRIADEIQEELKQFGAAKVIVAPREANETDIALVAWGRLDTFNVEAGLLPVERINDFIKRYSNKGPERVQGASGGI